MPVPLFCARDCRGTVVPPGDKSITHRALLLGALAHGTTTLTGPLDAGDTRSTVRVLRALGVDVRAEGASWQVEGLGAGRFPAASADPQVEGPTLDCGNSGTTLRLLAGALAGRGGGARLVGDASLMRRPMARVADVLRPLGAQVTCGPDGRAPLVLRATAGRDPVLHAADVVLGLASAQIKSAFLLAALGANGACTVGGATASRDHTERMLPAFGATLHRHPDGRLTLPGPQALVGTQVVVPGDPSAAAFFWAAAAIIPGGEVTVRGVSLNPTRLGFLRALECMGARVEIAPAATNGEPIGDVRVRHAPLTGVRLGAAQVADAIDELPLLAAVACVARGTTEIAGAAELRHKESDRIACIAHNLAALGADVATTPDGLRVCGGKVLRGANVRAFGDHRIAMATAIAALRATGPCQLDEGACVAVSYPDFFAQLRRLTGQGGSQEA